MAASVSSVEGNLVHGLVIGPHGLTSTFYEASTYPESVIKRLAHGYFESKACADYQPQCMEPSDRRTGHARGQHLLDAIGRRCHLQPPRQSIAGCAPFL